MATETKSTAAAVAAFNEVLAWQQKGELARADGICQDLLQEFPGFADGWHLRGLLAFQRAQYELGIEFLQRSLTLNPLQPAAVGNIGSALLMLKRPAEALERFDEVLRLQGGSAAILYGRGNALLALGRSAEALAELDRALELQPEFGLALAGRGNALHRLRRFDEALLSLDRALTLSQDDFEALFSRGNVLLDLQRFEDALASYDRCILQQPAHIELLNNRGNALRQLRRYEEAHACYDRALALKPGLVETLSNRAAALLDVNRLPEALACYEAALRIKPDFVEAHFNFQLGACTGETGPHAGGHRALPAGPETSSGLHPGQKRADTTRSRSASPGDLAHKGRLFLPRITLDERLVRCPLQSRHPHRTAITSISTSASLGRRATCTVDRAGGSLAKHFAYTSFIAPKWFMSLRNTVDFTTWPKSRPCDFNRPRTLSRTRVVCSVIPPATMFPVPGSSGTCPAQNK